MGFEEGRGFFKGIITEKSLRKHLEEKVFMGNSENDIVNLMISNKGPARLGVLRQLDSRFYVQVCTRESPLKGAVWTESEERYLLKDGDLIRIGSPKDNWGNYKIKI